MSRTQTRISGDKPELEAETLQSYIERLVDTWPPLSTEQKAHLAGLLRAGRSDA